MGTQSSSARRAPPLPLEWCCRATRLRKQSDTMPEPTTVRAVLETGLAGANAIGAPGRPSLTYGGLREHVDRTVATLNAMGIGRGERLAIVLPNGPEMASAFVSIASGATTAPLNPGYKRKEYDFYIEDLGAKALDEFQQNTRMLGGAVAQ